MNLLDKAWEHTVCATGVLARVERRLVDQGSMTELRQLQRLSAQEMDVLVYRETHEPMSHQRQQLTYPVANIDGVSPSSCPQTTRASVAA